MIGKFINHSSSVRHFILEPTDGSPEINICLGPTQSDTNLVVENSATDVVFAGNSRDLSVSNSEGSPVLTPPNENLIINGSSGETIFQS